jgi:3-oxoacyl-[acyl-carrier protein] reductase
MLQNDVVLITGGTAGIGKAIAKKCHEEGAKVVIFGRNQQRGEEVIQELPGAEFYSVDVASYSDVEKAIEQVLAKHGRVDVLVNNAGITRDNLMARMKEEDWDIVVDTNLKSCFNTCKALYRPMLKARKGRIINISSVVGLTGNAGQINYSASKSGIIGFTKSLAKELASRNILVNCIAPGFIETEMTGALDDKRKEQVLGMIPLGRMGSGEEIANTVLFLASKMSTYITGQVITVDGGMV